MKVAQFSMTVSIIEKSILVHLQKIMGQASGAHFHGPRTIKNATFQNGRQRNDPKHGNFRDCRGGFSLLTSTNVTEKKLFLEVAELSYKNSFEKTIYCSDLAFHHHPAHDEKEILQLLD